MENKEKTSLQTIMEKMYDNDSLDVVHSNDSSKDESYGVHLMLKKSNSHEDIREKCII